MTAIENTIVVISCGSPLTLHKPTMTVEELKSRLWRRNGWILVEASPVFGDGIQAPGYIVLCNTRQEQYATYFFNEQDGGCHSGSYHDSEAQAFEAYDQRVRRNTRHHGPSWTVADTEAVYIDSEGRSRYCVIHRCPTEEEAAHYIGNEIHDTDKVVRGAYEICDSREG